jgi:hypothetical protein
MSKSSKTVNGQSVWLLVVRMVPGPSESSKQQHALASDREISSSKTFRFWSTINLQWGKMFHDLSAVGMNNIVKDKGLMVIGFHSSHNTDIFVGTFMIENATGRVVRGMMHRGIFSLMPWLEYLGLVSGDRHTAEKALSSGFIAGEGKLACLYSRLPALAYFACVFVCVASFLFHIRLHTWRCRRGNARP